VVKRLATPRNLVILLLIVALFALPRIFPVLQVGSPVVSLASEPIFHIGSFAVTNTVFTAWLVMLVLIVVAFLATRRIPRDFSKASNQDLVPSGLQNFMEMVIEYIWNLAAGIGGKWTPKFFPIITTIFLFVLVGNWTGLLPGFSTIGLLEPSHDPAQPGFVVQGRILTAEPAAPVEAAAETSGESATGEGEAAAGAGYILIPFLRAPATDLNFTLALGLMAIFLVQYFGVRALGPGYFKKFFDTSGFKQGAFMGAIGIFVGILELISEFARILSFGFRLFGNVFAGEVLLGVMAFLIPYLVSIPFYGLELFVGFIQAAVFMMLSLVFFSTATAGHGSEEHH
jgi:F-type H+-transporting ATPase subunit a